MSRRKITIKIVNGKVELSQEVLNIIESWRTEENSEWVNKYLEIILDKSNINNPKYHKHHIIPCFMFKENIHTSRKETEKLADSIEGNVLKLSISNHIKAHNYLRLIFPNNKYARWAILQLCGEEKYNDSLSEEEINEIAKIEEDCAKENLTKEEIAKNNKKWREEHKEDLRKKQHEKYINNIDEMKKKNHERYVKNRDERLQKQKEYAQNNKEKIFKYLKEYGKIYRKTHKKEEQERHKNYYENNKEEISKKTKERNKKNKDKISEYQKNYKIEHKEEMTEYHKKRYIKKRDIILEKQNKRNHQKCYDPIKRKECSYLALQTRIYRNKELYDDVNLRDCIIKNESVIS